MTDQDEHAECREVGGCAPECPWAPPPTDAQILAGAVEIAFWHVTGLDPVEKVRQREYLHDLMSGLRLGRTRPTTEVLREAIGDTDDKEVRAALDRWAGAEKS